MDQATSSAQQLSDPLVFRREVFTYVTENRRNPFSPSGPMIAANPTVRGVRLLGIIHHPQAHLSVVLLEGGMQSEKESGAGSAGMHLPGGVRLRVGGFLEGIRIAEIHADSVVVEIARPGGVTRRVMRMRRLEAGRGP